MILVIYSVDREYEGELSMECQPFRYFLDKNEAKNYLETRYNYIENRYKISTISVNYNGDDPIKEIGISILNGDPQCIDLAKDIIMKGGY